MANAKRFHRGLAEWSLLFLAASVSTGMQSDSGPASPAAPEMVLQFGHGGVIAKLVASDDGRRLMSISFDHTVRLWDVPSGQLLRSLPEASGESFRAAHFQKSDQPFVIGLTRSEIRVRDLASGQATATGQASDGTDASYSDVAWSADGKTLALRGARYGAPITLYSTATGAALGSFDTSQVVGGGCVSLSADGSLLAHAQRWVKPGTHVWDVSSNRKLFVLPDASGSVHADLGACPVFTADGRQLVIPSYDGAVRFWDMRTGKLLRIFESTFEPPDPKIGNSCSKPCISALAISSDGRWMARGTDGATVSLWDLSTGQVVRRVTEPQGDIYTLAIGPEGRWVAYGGSDYDIRILDALTGQRRVLSTNPDLVRAVACSAKGRICAFGTRDKRIRVWDITTGSETVLGGHASQVNAVAFSSDGRWLASGSGDKTVKIWDTASNAEARTLLGHRRAITSVAVSSDGRWVASGSVGGDVKIWDRQSGNELQTLKATTAVEENDRSDSHRVVGVHFNGNGRELTAAYADGEVTSFDITAGTVRHSFNSGRLPGQSWSSGAQTAVWSPDDRWIAVTYTGGNVTVWNMAEGVIARRLSQGAGFVLSAAFSPDGRWLATGSADTTIKLWDTRTWTASTLRGHQGFVKSVAFGPDQQRLISGSGDGTVRIWDVASSRLMAVVVARKDGGQSVVVSPTGLFDGTADSMQQVAWRVPNTLEVAPLDAFFTDFFRPGLFADLMTGADPEPPVELAAVLQVPGLRTMLAQKQAHIETRDGRPVVCFAEPPRVAANVPVTERRLRPRVVGGFRIDPNDQTCPYQKELPVTGPNPAALTEQLINWKPNRVSTVWDGKLSTDTAGSTLHVFTAGVGDYPSDSGFDRLPYAVASARAIESFFRRQSGLRSPYAAVRVWDGLYDARATRDAVRQRLAEMARTIRDDDVVLLYLAGHGVVSSGQEMFYYVPIDGRDADLRRTGVNTAMLADGIRNLKARRVVLFIDACQSGAAVGPLSQIATVKAQVEMRRAEAEPNSTGQGQGVGVHLIAATLPLSYAVQITQEQSALAATVLTALQQGREITTVGQVTSYLSQNLADASARVAAGFRQVPLIDSVGLDFPIAWR